MINIIDSNIEPATRPWHYEILEDNILFNRFQPKNNSKEELADSYNEYEYWLCERIAMNDQRVLNELDNIVYLGTILGRLSIYYKDASHNKYGYILKELIDPHIVESLAKVKLERELKQQWRKNAESKYKNRETDGNWWGGNDTV